MIQPDALAMHRSLGLADLDQQQFVVGAAAAQQGRAIIKDPALDIQADDFTVEFQRALEVAHVKYDMSQIYHHGPQL